MKNPSDLENHVGYWLRVVSNHVHSAFAAKLTGSKVTVAEWIILRHLYGKEDLSQDALARRAELTKGAISKLADRLLKKNLIILGTSNQDKRRHKLRLSAAGNRLIPELARLADKNDSEFFECLTKNERRTLLRLMRSIVSSNKIRNSATM